MWLTDYEFFTYAKIVICDIVVWLIISFILMLMAICTCWKCPKCPDWPPGVYQPIHRVPYTIGEEIEISTDPSDFEMPAAFVKVNEAKRGMEGSDDGEQGDKIREVISDESDDLD